MVMLAACLIVGYFVLVLIQVLCEEIPSREFRKPFEVGLIPGLLALGFLVYLIYCGIYRASNYFYQQGFQQFYEDCTGLYFLIWICGMWIFWLIAATAMDNRNKALQAERVEPKILQAQKYINDNAWLVENLSLDEVTRNIKNSWRF